MDSEDSASRYALDAGAFYSGVVFMSSAFRYWTTRAVLEEVKHIKKSHGAIEALIESNTLQLVNSDRKSIQKVIAGGKGDRRLCKTFRGRHLNNCPRVELEIGLVTNDYAVANVATTLKITVKSVAGKGITQTRRWIAYCSALAEHLDLMQKSAGCVAIG